MIREFFSKKENLFIIAVGAISLLLVGVGFLFLFLRPDVSDGPKKVPSNVNEIVWNEFDSDLIKNDLQYPGHLYVGEQEKETGTGITVSESKLDEFLTYFSNKNHVSIYPSGIDAPFFYGKTKESEYTSSTGQGYLRTEFLTTDDKVWAVMLVPKEQFESWQSRGFIWMQARISNKIDLCVSSEGILIDSLECDPYAGHKAMYEGEVSDKFIRLGYEIINRNTFK